MANQAPTGLTFLIHSQHSGSSAQQCLHHRSQAVTCCKMEGPARECGKECEEQVAD